MIPGIRPQVGAADLSPKRPGPEIPVRSPRPVGQRIIRMVYIQDTRRKYKTFVGRRPAHSTSTTKRRSGPVRFGGKLSLPPPRTQISFRIVTLVFPGYPIMTISTLPPTEGAGIAGGTIMKMLPAVFLLCLCAAAPAQQAVDIRPGIIEQIEGEVYLDDVRLLSPPDRPVAAEVLRTGEGKVEMQLGLWATLWLGARSSLLLEERDYHRMSLVLLGGSAIVEIIEGVPDAAKLTARLGDAAVEIQEAGVYRFDAGAGRVRVYDGKARVLLGEESEALKRGRSAHLAEGLGIAKFDRERGGCAAALGRLAFRPALRPDPGPTPGGAPAAPGGERPAAGADRGRSALADIPRAGSAAGRVSNVADRAAVAAADEMRFLRSIRRILRHSPRRMNSPRRRRNWRRR